MSRYSRFVVCRLPSNLGPLFTANLKLILETKHKTGNRTFPGKTSGKLLEKRLIKKNKTSLPGNTRPESRIIGLLDF